MVHNIEMVKRNLNYANNELSSALVNLKKFATINNTALNGNRISNTVDKVKNQIDILDRYIIPAAKKM